MKFSIKTHIEHLKFDKLIRSGLIIDLYDIDPTTIEDYTKINDKIFYIHNFTVDIYKFLDLILVE